VKARAALCPWHLLALGEAFADDGVSSGQITDPSEPENQSNLKKEHPLKILIFSINFRARGHSFSNPLETLGFFLSISG
jgi:hypothetical protein